ncbi:MAG TPA: carboxypeptidase-like regulatory domain-containing protein [Cyclobacteriaceae bacterium]|nr:carboxypeptidase-like regulatory domain-containing protein [Cyclobacteriaceae bacterium]
MAKTYCLILFCFAAVASFAQTGSISGRVIDSESLEPLPFANVFINNTTLGTSTSDKGEFTIKDVPVGTPELIFSFIGYQAYQVRVTVKDGEVLRMNIKLIPLKEQLAEVQVKGTRDKAWEKQLKKFEKIFLGSDDLGRQCKILNPAEIDFPKTEGDVFKAVASAPIDIENRALGYMVHYYLKSFTSDDVSYAIVGNARFEELSPVNAEEASRWVANRKDAYLGSARHLFKALIDDRLTEEGFRLYTTRGGVAVTARTRVFANELDKNIVPFKPSGVVSPGANMYERKITLGGKIEVHYLNDPTIRPAYTDVPHAVTWLEMKNGFVRTNLEGIMLNPLEVVYSGDMGMARVSNMLPLDYQTNGVVKVKGEKQVEVLKMYEKTYLHTSKSFYYPGEILWFKAYMNYGARDMRDTLSTVLYVDLIDSDRKVLQSKTVRIENTIAAGDFNLPNKLKPGMYALVAYTNWMRNFGSKSYFIKPIPVLDLYEKINGSGVVSASNSRELEIETDKESYGPRELVKVTLNLLDEAEKPVGGNFSVSVTDLTQVPVATWVKEDIVPGMAIPGNVELPGNKFTQRVEYGVTWRGEFLSDTRKREKTDLTVVQGAFENVQKITTDENGAFSILNLDIYDSVLFSVQALKKGQLYGSVETKPRDIPFAEFKPTDYNVPIERKGSIQRVISPYEVPKDAILLENVTVRSTKLFDSTRHVPNLFGRGDVVIQGEDINRFGSMEALIRQKALGFRLNFDGTHWRLIHIRGEASMPPAALENVAIQVQGGRSADGLYGSMNTNPMRIDRTPEPTLTIDNRVQTISSGETIGDRLMYMEIQSIDRVEISSVGSSYTGSQGSYGIVSVFLKKGTPPSKSTFHRVFVKGFDFPQEFKSPDYASTTEDHSQGDYRALLYWNRSVRVDAGGWGQFSFYTSDLSGQYRMVIEGVNFEGRPIHVEKVITVEPK